MKEVCTWLAIFAGIAIIAAVAILWLAINAVARCLAILKECVAARNKAEKEAATAKSLHRAVLARLDNPGDGR